MVFKKYLYLQVTLHTQNPYNILNYNTQQKKNNHYEKENYTFGSCLDHVRGGHREVSNRMRPQAAIAQRQASAGEWAARQIAESQKAGHRPQN